MRRREFLGLFAPAAVSPARAWQAPPAPGRIRITDVRLVRLRTVREAGVLEPAWNPGGQMRITVGGGSFTEIRTDQGLAGIGPGMAEELLPAVKAQLVGKDPFDIEEHSARLRYYARGTAYRGSACADIAVAHLHLVAAWAHAPYLEVLHDPPVGDYRHAFAIFQNPPLVDKDGTIALPQAPGLGVEIDPGLIERAA
jgi:L-alanine-DL-glutamate epimerase-like enolase superfamily enzyme